jgi:hypothetical protein
MKKRLSPQEWAEEFKEFASTSDKEPPKHLSEQILKRVHVDLNPATWLVAAKLSMIHLVTGTMTLLFCPQFGVNLGGGMGLMGLFMKYGDHACMVGCGAVFMAGSALTASIFLRPEEVRKIRKTELLLFPAMGLFSMGAFLCVGAPIAFSLALFWLIGSVLGGLATLELGWLIRMRSLSPS